MSQGLYKSMECIFQKKTIEEQQAEPEVLVVIVPHSYTLVWSLCCKWELSVGIFLKKLKKGVIQKRFYCLLLGSAEMLHLDSDFCLVPGRDCKVCVLGRLLYSYKDLEDTRLFGFTHAWKDL